MRRSSSARCRICTLARYCTGTHRLIVLRSRRLHRLVFDSCVFFASHRLPSPPIASLCLVASSPHRLLASSPPSPHQGPQAVQCDARSPRPCAACGLRAVQGIAYASQCVFWSCVFYVCFILFTRLLILSLRLIILSLRLIILSLRLMILYLRLPLRLSMRLFMRLPTCLCVYPPGAPRQ
jgi:hypothetical protein